jgi:hypothetical protein
MPALFTLKMLGEKNTVQRITHPFIVIVHSNNSNPVKENGIVMILKLSPPMSWLIMIPTVMEVSL